MTSIEITRDVEITDGQILSTLILLQQAVNYIPEGGILSDELARRVSLRAVLNASDEKAPIQFEDADLATAKACVLVTKWNNVSDYIAGFIVALK